MNILILGESSNLSKSLVRKLEVNHHVFKAGRRGELEFDASDISVCNIKNLYSQEYDVYVFNIGVLYSKKINDQRDDEIMNSLSVNLIFIIRSCEYIIERNEKARIFIVGSESGKKGSYDTTYFLSKSALRSYVHEKRLKYVDQQLLLVSPSLIIDGGMTERRGDIGAVRKLEVKHPKQRYLNCDEVAGLLLVLIENITDYLTNTEIELNGGKFSRMVYE